MTKNCELLGVCQNQQRECPGACEQTPSVPFWLQEPEVEQAPPFSMAEKVLILISATVLVGFSAGLIWAAAVSIYRTLSA